MAVDNAVNNLSLITLDSCPQLYNIETDDHYYGMFTQRGESAGYGPAEILAKPATLANPLCLKTDVLYIPKYLLASHEI